MVGVRSEWLIGQTWFYVFCILLHHVYQVGTSPSGHHRHHRHHRHHHRHHLQYHHPDHQHHIQVVVVPHSHTPQTNPPDQTLTPERSISLPIPKSTAQSPYRLSSDQEAKFNVIDNVPDVRISQQSKGNIVIKPENNYINEVSQESQSEQGLSGIDDLSQVDHGGTIEQIGEEKEFGIHHEKLKSLPTEVSNQNVKVHKQGNTSQLVEVVTMKNTDPKTKSKSPGYRILRNKNHLGRNPQNPLLRPKPLLDHFHGLHFGIIDPADFPQRPPVKASYSVEGTFLWAIGLFGTVENGAVLLTTLFSRKFKKPLHLLIGSLSLTDLFVSLIYIPSYTYYLLEGDRLIQGGDPDQAGSPRPLIQSTISFCKLSRSIFVEIASVTLTLKALIAVYLYVSACSRERVSQIFSTRNTAIYIGMAWAMNFFMLFIPNFLGYPEVDFYPNSFICLSDRQIERHHGSNETTSSAIYTFLTLGVHMIELTIVCLCFIKVHLAIIQGKIYSDKHRSSDKQAQINYMRALKITCLVFASFCICWMPIYVINILDPTHTTLPTDVHHLVMDLLLLKSSINPTIYIYGIRSLRHEIKLLCLCRCRKDNHKSLLVARKVRSLSDEGMSRTFSTVSGGV